MNTRFCGIAVAAITAGSVMIYGDAIDDYAVGRKDAAIKSTVKSHYRPHNYVTESHNDINLWQSLLKVDASDNDDGSVLNRYATTMVTPAFDSQGVPLNLGFDRIVPPEWWKSSDMMTSAAMDLYNIVVCDQELMQKRKSLPLADVTNVESDNGFWRYGTSPLYGSEKIQCIEPPAEYKGDFARALMYMVSVYPPSIWQGWGDVMLLGNEYPTMRDHSVTLYLKWHYDDPVSPLELQRNDRIEAIQGNRNPFVDHPELIDYIWGRKAGEIYGTHDAPVDPDDPDRKRTPLKGNYTAADGAVDLYSPYVPDDAEWTIDLQPVAGKSLPIDDIAAGRHELRYTAGDMKGRLIINITK